VSSSFDWNETHNDDEELGECAETWLDEVLEELLLDIIPRKVVAEPRDALAMVTQLNAFYRFAARAFEASNAAPLLAMPTPELADEMQRRMADPRNFGIAKSLLARGAEAGFDMGTEEGIAAAMADYNRSLVAPRESPAQALSRSREDGLLLGESSRSNVEGVGGYGLSSPSR
jgi:hypothetical protein